MGRRRGRSLTPIPVGIFLDLALTLFIISAASGPHLSPVHTVSNPCVTLPEGGTKELFPTCCGGFPLAVGGVRSRRHQPGVSPPGGRLRTARGLPFEEAALHLCGFLERLIEIGRLENLRWPFLK